MYLQKLLSQPKLNFEQNLCLGCIDSETDCEECEYCNEEHLECRAILCNCVPPSHSIHHEFEIKDDNEAEVENPLTEENHAHFVCLSSTRCMDEAEVECSDGYVYFDPNADVGKS